MTEGSLFEKFEEALKGMDGEGSKAAMSFVEENRSNVQKVLSPFQPDGHLLGKKNLPASCFNDFYKWTMFPVVWTTTKAKGDDLRCTFSVNIRDEKWRKRLYDSATGVASSTLFDEVKANLASLTKRKFDRKMFEQCIQDYKLPGWTSEALDAVCGPKGRPRALVEKFSCLETTSPMDPPKNEVLLQVFAAYCEKCKEERIYIEAAGPWHKTTWLETSMMQAVYEPLFRDKKREEYGEEDSVWYPKWLAVCLCRCARSVAAAVESKLLGALFTGRRTGGLALMMLQAVFTQQAWKSPEGKLMSLGTSSVTAHYKCLELGIPPESVPPCAGTHAHELSMVVGAVLGEVDDKAGMPLGQIIGHMLYFYTSRPLGDVQKPERKPLMPMLSDTLGTRAFMKTAKMLKVPFGPHGGQPVLSVIGSARQDSGGLEQFKKLMEEFEFPGSMMASEIETADDLFEARDNGFKLFGAGGFMGDSEKAWDKSKPNISMACKVLRVYVNGTRLPTKYGPVKTGETSDEGKIKEGKFEADGTLSAAEIQEVKDRSQVQADAVPLLGEAEMQKLFSETLMQFPGVNPAEVDMKVTVQKSQGFYISSAKRLLEGYEDKEGLKKEAVCVLNISGLGAAINTAIATATAVESEGLGIIKKIETSYPELGEDGRGRGIPRISIKIHHK